MTITESAFVDISQQAAALGLADPERVAFLPRNFETATTRDHLMREESEATVRKLWRQAGIEVESIDPDDLDVPVVHERDLTWIGPTIVFGIAYLSENPNLVSVALGVIANYLTDIFKGVSPKPNVKLKVVVKTTKTTTTRQLDYEGDPSGLTQLADAVKELARRE